MSQIGNMYMIQVFVYIFIRIYVHIYTRACKSIYMCVRAQMCESPSLFRPTLHSVFLHEQMRNYM